jgi:spore coat protein A
MALTRRDLVKMSVLAGAAVALPLERSVSGSSALANRIASSRLPAPFTTPFAVPPLIYPVRRSGSSEAARPSSARSTTCRPSIRC